MKFHKFFLPVFFLSFYLSTICAHVDLAYAGIDEWTVIGPEGGFVNAIAIDPQNPSNVYVGTSGSGLFKSTDGGLTWSAIVTGLTSTYVGALAIDPQNPSRVLAGTNGGVYRSTDGGTNWSAASIPSASAGPFAINPLDPSVVYAGTSNGLIKSTDGGANWFAINASGLSGNIVTIAINPLNPMILYAGTPGGIYRSTDAGTTWSAHNSDLTRRPIEVLAVDPQDPNIIYAGTWGGVLKSTDAWYHWESINSGLTNLYVSALCIDPQNPSILYAGTDEGLFKTVNGGTNWVAANAGLVSVKVSALALNPQSTNTVFAGTQGSGIFKSTDAGTYWNLTNKGLINTRILSLVFDPTDPDIIYSGTYEGGAFRSTNRGSEWTVISTGLSDLRVEGLAISPKAPGTIYAMTWGGGVFKSSNGGDNWTAVNSGLPSMAVGALTVDPQDPNTVYAGVDGWGMYKSIDGGTNWSAINAGLTMTFRGVAALAIDPEDPDTIYAGTDYDGIYKSTNGGSTWRAINVGLGSLSISALAIDPQNPDIIYAGIIDFVGNVFLTRYGAIYKTIDGGETWNPVNFRLPYLDITVLVVNPLNPNIIYAGTFAGVFKSRNSGVNWNAMNAGLTSMEVNTLVIDPSDQNILYAGTGNGVCKIEQVANNYITVVSPNGGDTWVAGSTQTIQWGYGGNAGSYVKIELLKGEVVNQIIESSTSIGIGGNGSYNWVIPAAQVPGSDYRVRITSTDNGSYTDTSDNYFTIVTPSAQIISLVSPNGGETLTAGSPQTIRWSYTADPSTYVKIELLKAGVVNSTIASSVSIGTGGTGSCSWTIPANQTPGTDYRIRVTSTNGAYTDTSDRDFTIAAPTITVASPNSGETWTAGTIHTIRWTYTGNPGPYVKIELLKGGVVNRTIASFAWKGNEGIGSRRWKVPLHQAPGIDYRIRVTGTNGVYTAISDGDFTIAAPTITVVSPNSGVTFAAGSTQTIRWNYTGNPGPYVKIELLKGGVVNRTIKSFVWKGTGGNRSFNWRVPANQAPGTDYRIRVTSTSNNSYSDTSDNNFTISK